MHKFSVVIAAYNQKDHVLEAVQSVTAQTYPAHEIIVVVDGSTDGTAEALRDRFPGVRVFEQPNLGKGIARNTGIAMSSGDWICLLDHDDLWHREKLETIATYLSTNPECQAVNHPIWFFSTSEDGPKSCFGLSRDFVAADLEGCHQAAKRQGESTNNLDYLNIQGDSLKLLLERNRGALSGSVVQREILIRAGCFCPMQANGEDWTLFVNVARLCEWHTIPRRLGFTRLHSRQDTLTLTTSGLIILTGLANAWCTGRPLRESTPGMSFLAQLEKYGPIYRETAQVAFWDALYRGQFRLAGMIRSVAKLILPRWADWFYMHVPPQITWRWQRYVCRTQSAVSAKQ